MIANSSFESAKGSVTTQKHLELVPVAAESLPKDLFSNFNGATYFPDVTWVESAYVLAQDGGDTQYLIEKKAAGGVDGKDNRRVCLVGYRDGIYTGYTEIDAYVGSDERMPENRFAWVAFTETEPDFVKQGLGRERLIQLNQYSLQKFDMPLASGKSVRDGARSVWEKLVQDGLAEHTGGDATGRFEFRFLRNI